MISTDYVRKKEARAALAPLARGRQDHLGPYLLCAVAPWGRGLPRAGAGPGQDPDLLAQRESRHWKKKTREREFLGNEAPYGPLLAERFKIFFITRSNLEGFLAGLLPNCKSALQPAGIHTGAADGDPGNCRAVWAEIFHIIQHETDTEQKDFSIQTAQVGQSQTPRQEASSRQLSGYCSPRSGTSSGHAHNPPCPPSQRPRTPVSPHPSVPIPYGFAIITVCLPPPREERAGSCDSSI